MTLIIDLEPEMETRLRAEAGRRGQDAVESLRTLPIEERDKILAAAAEEAAPFYNADLALPVEQRELTAFTALDGEPFYDYDDIERQS